MFANIVIGGKRNYQIANSLRFRRSASAYLNRTAGTPTSQNVWTFSCWAKLGVPNGVNYLPLLSSGPVGTSTWPGETLYIKEDGRVAYDSATAGGTNNITKRSNQLLRDPSAWYHIVAQKTAAANSALTCVRLWVNGVEITSWQTNTYTGTQASVPDYINVSTQVHTLGHNFSEYLDGYLADTYFIDGQALTPSSFGQTDTNGQWIPKPYTGAYGTNGFYLGFRAAANVSQLGTDTAFAAGVKAENNFWTVNNASLTAGATYDWMLDTPTNTYCVLSELDGNNATLSAANLSFVTNVASTANTVGTIYVSTGKWYWEVTPTANGNVTMLGVRAGNLGNSHAYYGNTGNMYTNLASPVAYGATYTNNDVIGLALDMDANTLECFKNNVSQGVFAMTIAGPLSPFISDGSSTGGVTGSANFGQRPFTYTPPAGFKALCTQNLPAPAIPNPKKHFDVVTWTGDGSASNRDITGLQFLPGLLWAKSRSASANNLLTSEVTGFPSDLATNTISPADFGAGNVLSALSNGFRLAAGSRINTNTVTFVGFAWAVGPGVTNNAGSITATVGANPAAGISVAQYNGTSAAGTIGHGLGAPPELIVVKNETNSTNWEVWHSALTSAAYSIQLNLTNAQASAPTVWNSTAPTSTVFSVGTSLNTNSSTVFDMYGAFCFRSIPGFSKVFSFSSTGTADGPFVYLGFRPALILYKCAGTATTNWVLYDTKRNTVNVGANWLLPNQALAEQTSGAIDILSNGFKIRSGTAGTSDLNGLAGTLYVGIAFAEYPFGGYNSPASNAR